MAFTWDCWMKFIYKAADLHVRNGTQYCKKTATREVAGCQCDWHTHKNPQNTTHRRDPGNYRPESLSSILTKGSRGYKNKVTVDNDKCGLLEKMLHGFCKEKPCLTNPPESSECITKARERRSSRHSTAQFWKSSRFHTKGYQRN